MFTYARLGDPRRGRLGNQLFQIASTIGLAITHAQIVRFPRWQYDYAFPSMVNLTGDVGKYQVVPEGHFHYEPEGFFLQSPNDNISIDGWRQSERYWEQCKPFVKAVLKFSDSIVGNVRGRYAAALSKPTIAISVRRGDFVDNPNYEQLPITYYLLALLEHFPKWQDYHILIFSDDLPYCQVHFEGLPNVFFAEGLDACEQLCLMAQCDHFIISNSTFSWWGAWLGEKKDTKVIRPARVFDGPLKAKNSEADYWPARWQAFDHAGRRLDLRDTTFTIPVFIDHAHRIQNLELSVCMLQRDFDTNILIGEQGSSAAWHLQQACQYGGFPQMKVFHRTKMLNDMALAVSTPYVVNWDCDVILPPLQLWLAVQRLRAGEDMVYPYDGRFARMPRSWHKKLERSLDIGVVGATEFTGKHGKPVPVASVGGAIMFNRESFIQGGLENENMISFAPEDHERIFRFKALGYTVSRVTGSLYHLDHWCGPDSSSKNPYFRRNHMELKKMKGMSPAKLAEYVEGWTWRQQALK